MSPAQPGILSPLPPRARYLTFVALPGPAVRPPLTALAALAALVDGASAVVGLGPSLVLAAGGQLPGMRGFPALDGSRRPIPATPADLWIWLRGDDRGALYHASRRLEAALAPAFGLHEAVDAFMHGSGRDLTGYEDGTENPAGEAAEAAALVGPAGAAPPGSSFVAVQRWAHWFDRFDAMTPAQQDAAIGRRRSDNAELADAPPSAHVKRTAQESFDPAAFVLRRSMPWAEGMQAGLMFVAFGATLDAFEAQLRRMAGLDDGIEDALFGFTRPVTGAYFWCPPMRGGRLDLGVLGL
jgi:putative iron-dependent peroxidase